MIENTGLYALFPALAALCCIFLFKKLIERKSGREYLLLFANLALINCAQLTAYLLFPHSLQIAEYAADAYLIFAYFLFCHLVMFSLSLSAKPIIKREHFKLLYIAPTLLTVLHASGFIIENYRVEQNSLMHNDGILNWCFDAYILVSCFTTILFFLKNLKLDADDRILVSKNMIALLSFIPLALTSFIVILLSTTPYAVSVAIIGPFASLYSALMFFYLSRDSVADLSIGIVSFYERLKIAYLLLETNKTKTDMKRFNKHVERQFIKEALTTTDGNIQAAADYLGLNHTTLRNKIKEYHIDVEKISSKYRSIST